MTLTRDGLVPAAVWVGELAGEARCFGRAVTVWTHGRTDCMLRRPPARVYTKIGLLDLRDLSKQVYSRATEPIQ